MIDQNLYKDVVNIFALNHNDLGLSTEMPNSTKFKNFLKTFTKPEITEIREIFARVNSGENLENKKEIIRELLLINYNKYLNKKENYKRNTISQLRNLDKGFFIKNNVTAKYFEKTCNQTYKGFFRALKSETLQTAKVKIDGKLTRVFIKNRIGEYGNLEGRNPLFINPQNLNVYSFKSNRNSKITDILKIIDFEKGNIKISQEVKQYAYAFKKELYEKIKEKYFKNKKPISFKKTVKKKVPKPIIKKK